MKKIFAAIAALGLAATVAFAQDYNAAVEAFNAGATALESNKTEALAQFRGEELDAIGEIRSSQEGQGENLASSYDLSGRSVGRVSASLSKGIYLIGGKKVVR